MDTEILIAAGGFAITVIGAYATVRSTLGKEKRDDKSYVLEAEMRLRQELTSLDERLDKEIELRHSCQEQIARFRITELNRQRRYAIAIGQLRTNIQRLTDTLTAAGASLPTLLKVNNVDVEEVDDP